MVVYLSSALWIYGRAIIRVWIASFLQHDLLFRIRFIFHYIWNGKCRPSVFFIHSRSYRQWSSSLYYYYCGAFGLSVCLFVCLCSRWTHIIMSMADIQTSRQAGKQALFQRVYVFCVIDNNECFDLVTW